MKRIFSLLIGCLIILVSCKKSNNAWESGYLVPLVKTSVSINDIVKDSLIRKDGENISLVYSNDAGTVEFGNLVEMPDVVFNKTSRLSDLQLPNNTFKADITMGMIAQNWPVWGPIIIANHGSNLVLPDIYNIMSGPHAADIQDIFQEATFVSGYMDITLINTFPSDVSNLDYELRNANSGTVFVNHSFPYVAAGATEYATIDLAGKTLEGSIDARLLNMNLLVGNQSILIDTADALDITITLRDLVISTATAIFPSQNVVDDRVSSTLPIAGAKLTHARVSGGDVIIDVTTTAQDTIYFNYQIPGATLQGNSFSTNTIVPPAPAGGSTTVSFNYDFSGYDISLTGENGTETNTLFSHLIGRIDSTSGMITLSQTDSIRVALRIENLEPEYVEGYLGNEQFNIGPESSDFKIYKNVVEGQLKLEDIATSFTIENGVGVSSALNVQSLTSLNTKTQESVQLTGELVDEVLRIPKAYNDPYSPVFVRKELSNENSNIVDLLSIMPDQLLYEFNVELNKGIDSSNTYFKDFADLKGYIHSTVDFELPLSLIADNLTLRDTVNFDDDTKLELDQVKEGKLYLIADNGFPLSSSMGIKLLDDGKKEIGSLESNEMIEMAALSNNRVTEEQRTVLTFDITPGLLLELANTSYLVVTASFQSPSNSEFVTLYSEYELKVGLSGEFIYINE